MLKELLLAGLLGTAAAGGAAIVPSQSPAAPQKARQATTPQKQTAQEEPAPHPGDGRAATANAGPASRPKVTEIKEAELKSLLGTGAGRVRPLLVNFWATWCPPCREEFPDLVRLRKKYAADKLDFVLVSLDDPSDIDTAVPAFLAEVRANAFPAYLLHAKDDGAAINLVDPTWGGELPATFLYDRTGALVFKHKGRINPAQLRAAVEKALKDRPQQASARK